jgi:hypothetical protein
VAVDADGLVADEDCRRSSGELKRRLMKRRAVEPDDVIVVVVVVIDVGAAVVLAVVIVVVMRREMAVGDGVVVVCIRLVDMRRGEGRGQRQVRPDEAGGRRTSQGTTSHMGIIRGGSSRRQWRGGQQAV